MQGTILPGITRKGIMEIAQDCGYEVNDYTLSDTSGFCFFLLLLLLFLLQMLAGYVPVDSGLYSRSHSF
jgi:branched-subunit amino acid aminotransferase/4-amino-4-deoxychorismate lyase